MLLPKPVALVGFFAAGTSQIVHQLASLYGVPSVQLDRMVEHAAGRSLVRLAAEEGQDSWRQLERKQLERALRQRPAALIALGEGALLDGRSRLLVSTEADLLFIRRSVNDSFARLSQKAAKAPLSEPLFAGSLPNSAAELIPLLTERQAGYQSARCSVVAEEKHPSDVARAVADILGW